MDFCLLTPTTARSEVLRHGQCGKGKERTRAESSEGVEEQVEDVKEEAGEDQNGDLMDTLRMENMMGCFEK